MRLLLGMTAYLSGTNDKNECEQEHENPHLDEPLPDEKSILLVEEIA